jgi:MFS transporter, BCD family, chlorophyll transporter
VAVLLAAGTQSVALFVLGVLLIGFGGGLFGHGTLTLTMNRAPREQAGLALGAWGAVQATAAGAGVALGGIGRDLVQALAARGVFGESLAGPATGYAFVYGVEIVLLVATCVVMRALIGERRLQEDPPAPRQLWSAP